MTVCNKNAKIKRSTAQKLIERTADLIREYNSGDNPLKVVRMVVFGSYANSDKEMLSDVDIALSWRAKEENWNKWMEQRRDDMKRFYHRESDPDIIQIMTYMKREALVYFRQKSAWIQFTSLDYPGE